MISSLPELIAVGLTTAVLESDVTGALAACAAAGAGDDERVVALRAVVAGSFVPGDGLLSRAGAVGAQMRQRSATALTVVGLGLVPGTSGLRDVKSRILILEGPVALVTATLNNHSCVSC
jgi:hypothetical protein